MVDTGPAARVEPVPAAPVAAAAPVATPAPVAPPRARRTARAGRGRRARRHPGAGRAARARRGRGAGRAARARASGEEITAAILEIVAAQTGYPADMLDPDLDLEADLGIDTVKQAEMFAAVRERYAIARDDNLNLRDYPTLRHVVGFVEDRTTATGARAPPRRGAAPAPPAARAPPSRRGPAPAAPLARRRREEITAAILEIVAAQTGYPADMLDPELDLEADLGIDTVKQAEMFAAVRERYAIARDDTLNLRDYPTLRHVVGFVEDRTATTARTPAPAAAPPRRPTPRPRPSRRAAGPPPPRRRREEITAAILEIVAAQTGYPADMLDPDLDLEADLGIDTVKQAEMFAAIRERYAIARDDNLNLRDYPTLRHVVGFVEDRTADPGAPPRRPRPRPRRPSPPRRRAAGAVAAPAPAAAAAAPTSEESRPRSWRSSPPRPATRPTCSTPTSTSKPTSASTPSNRPRCSPPSASATRSPATTTSTSATTPPCATSSASSKTAAGAAASRGPRPSRARAAAPPGSRGPAAGARPRSRAACPCRCCARRSTACVDTGVTLDAGEPRGR